MPTIIAIGGGSAAGKTTLSKRVAQQCEDVTRISMDDFYKDQSHLSRQQRVEFNFDDPSAFKMDELRMFLHDVIHSKYDSAPKPTYDFETAQTGVETVEIPSIVILEGMWALDERLHEYIDIGVYVHADSTVRLARRVERDVDNRNMNVQEVVDDFVTNVRPMHEKHVEPTKKYADLIVRSDETQNGFSDVPVDAIVGAIENYE